MKKLFILLLVSLLAIPAFSQIKFGIKAGAETMTVPTYELSTGDINIEALENASWGFHGGLFVRITLLGLYIQPEAYFASTTHEYRIEEDGVDDILKDQTFNRLTVPILFGFKLGPIRLNAGPTAAISIGSPEALIEDPNFEEMYKGAIWGFQAGAGVDLFKRLTLDVRYGGSLGEKFGNSVNIGGQNFALDYGQQALILSLGFMF